jgi:hemerythrin-like metal-binding protein
MDREHIQLIAIMNRLASRSAAGAPKNDILQLLDELGSFTVQHFSDEEAFMANAGFPGLATHKRIHAELVQTLRQHVETYRGNSSAKLGPELLDFLKFWLGAHICGIDRRYAQHVHQQSA